MILFPAWDPKTQAWAYLGQALKEGWLGGVADCAPLCFNPTMLLKLLHAHAAEQPSHLHTVSMPTLLRPCPQPAASSLPSVELVY